MQGSSLTVSNASTANSTGGRSKVGLKPGHSLMDWVRYTHSGKDLTSTGGKCLEVTHRELAKHNTKNDAWISLKGKVYNITPYIDYHPGGEEELMRGAGKDATDLFNEVHRWVNAESMLQKCFVGFLKKPFLLDVHRFPFIKPIKREKLLKINPENTSTSSPETNQTNSVNTLSEWHTVPSSPEQREILLRLGTEKNKVVLKMLCIDMRTDELITEHIEENMFIKLNKNNHVQWLNIKIPGILNKIYIVKINQGETERGLEIDFNEVKCLTMKESKQSLTWSLCDRDTKSLFWQCKLINKYPVNYNTYLFSFQLPSHVRMWIPVGYHIQVKSDIEGVEIIRSYTPVHPLNSLEENLMDGCHIQLIIKIYPSGTLTPLINMCSIGETMLISGYAGNFSESLLETCDSIIMVAAGTGITPMIKIIKWALSAKDKNRHLSLLFFNKTEQDILWKEELEKCCQKYEGFQIIHILSDSDKKWTGVTGIINEEILKRNLPTKCDKQQVFICGPIPFNRLSVKLFESAGYNQEHIYVFSG